MLQTFDSEIRECYRHTTECSRSADQSRDMPQCADALKWPTCTIPMNKSTSSVHMCTRLAWSQQATGHEDCSVGNWVARHKRGHWANVRSGSEPDTPRLRECRE